MSIAGIWLGVSGTVGKDKLAHWESKLRDYTQWKSPISPGFTQWVERNRIWLGVLTAAAGILALAYGIIPAIQSYFRQFPLPRSNADIPVRCLLVCLPILMLVLLSQAANPAILLAPLRLALYPYNLLDHIVVKGRLESTLKIAGALLATAGVILLLL